MATLRFCFLIYDVINFVSDLIYWISILQDKACFTTTPLTSGIFSIHKCPVPYASRITVLDRLLFNVYVIITIEYYFDLGCVSPWLIFFHSTFYFPWN